MKLGSNDISSVKIGSTDVNKIYIGSTEVWSSFTGLLDTYSGAAAAYSLRQLKSGVTNAIRVRRASDNAESDIGFVSGQLDTTTLETFCSGTDGFVTTWYDQSGNGYDATQTTSSYQPQIVSSGSTILENGKPSLSFDGSDDYYSISINLGTINNLSEFIVNTYISGITFIGINDGNYGSVDRVITRQQSGNFVFAIRNATSGNNANIGTVAINTNQHILTSIYNGSGTSLLAIDGISQTSNTSTFGSMTLSDSLDISAIDNNGSIQEYGQNNIQELILYPSDQSSNRTGIETNINNFYNIY